MMGDLTVMSDFAARVKEKIKLDFAGMIPDEAWDKLVGEAVGSFVKDDLAKLVKEELAGEVKRRLQVFFGGPDWSEQWSADGGGTRTASEKVREIIRENIPSIVEAALGMAVQGMMNDLKYRLSSRM